MKPINGIFFLLYFIGALIGWCETNETSHHSAPISTHVTSSFMIETSEHTISFATSESPVLPNTDETVNTIPTFETSYSDSIYPSYLSSHDNPTSLTPKSADSFPEASQTLKIPSEATPSISTQINIPATPSPFSLELFPSQTSLETNELTSSYSETQNSNVSSVPTISPSFLEMAVTSNNYPSTSVYVSLNNTYLRASTSPVSIVLEHTTSSASIAGSSLRSSLQNGLSSTSSSSTTTSIMTESRTIEQPLRSSLQNGLSSTSSSSTTTSIMTESRTIEQPLRSSLQNGLSSTSSSSTTTSIMTESRTIEQPLMSSFQNGSKSVMNSLPLIRKTTISSSANRSIYIPVPSNYSSLWTGQASSTWNTNANSYSSLLQTKISKSQHSSIRTSSVLPTVPAETNNDSGGISVERIVYITIGSICGAIIFICPIVMVFVKLLRDKKKEARATSDEAEDSSKIDWELKWSTMRKQDIFAKRAGKISNVYGEPNDAFLSEHDKDAAEATTSFVNLNSSDDTELPRCRTFSDPLLIREETGQLQHDHTKETNLQNDSKDTENDEIICKRNSDNVLKESDNLSSFKLSESTPNKDQSSFEKRNVPVNVEIYITDENSPVKKATEQDSKSLNGFGRNEGALNKSFEMTNVRENDDQICVQLNYEQSVSEF